MVYEFRKEEIDCVGDVYRINVEGMKYLLFLSPTPDRKGNKLRWAIYLIDKNGDILGDASAPFGSTSFKNVTEELLGHLADKVKKKIGIDFSDTFMDILALNMGTEN